MAAQCCTSRIFAFDDNDDDDDDDLRTAPFCGTSARLLICLWLVA